MILEDILWRLLSAIGISFISLGLAAVLILVEKKVNDFVADIFGVRFFIAPVFVCLTVAVPAILILVYLGKVFRYFSE